MSAPGVQLYSQTPVKLFEPDVRTYVQKIEQAVVSNNLPVARQAFGQLEQAIRQSAPAAGKKESRAPEVAESLTNIDKALKDGNLAGATDAIAVLRTHLSIPAVGKVTGEPEASNQRTEKGDSSSDPTISVRI